MPISEAVAIAGGGQVPVRLFVDRTNTRILAIVSPAA